MVKNEIGITEEKEIGKLIDLLIKNYYKFKSGCISGEYNKIKDKESFYKNNINPIASTLQKLYDNKKLTDEHIYKLYWTCLNEHDNVKNWIYLDIDILRYILHMPKGSTHVKLALNQQDALRKNVIGQCKICKKDFVCAEVYSRTNYKECFENSWYGWHRRKFQCSDCEEKQKILEEEKRKQEYEAKIQAEKLKQEMVKQKQVEEEKIKQEIKNNWDKVSLNFTASYDEILNTLKYMPYEEYLQTDHWLHFRDETLKWAQNKCQLCNDTKNLHVHHKTYENRGRETFNDVIVLCKDCHRKFHNKFE
jgi:hypothetical protein